MVVAKPPANVSHLRLFCALEIPAEVAKAVAIYVEKLADEFANVKASWERAGRFHITLTFFGHIEETRGSVISEAAEKVSQSTQPFSLSLNEAGVFPGPNFPRVLWLGVKDPPGRVTALHGRLEEEFAREGFAKDTRPFHPHVTIARLRMPRSARELAAAHTSRGFESVKFEVNRLVVVQSQLDPHGARHTIFSGHGFRE